MCNTPAMVTHCCLSETRYMNQTKNDAQDFYNLTLKVKYFFRTLRRRGFFGISRTTNQLLGLTWCTMLWTTCTRKMLWYVHLHGRVERLVKFKFYFICMHLNYGCPINKLNRLKKGNLRIFFAHQLKKNYILVLQCWNIKLRLIWANFRLI